MIRTINPKMMPPAKLFGTFESSAGNRWKDGVLAAIFRDMFGIGQVTQNYFHSSILGKAYSLTVPACFQEEDAPHQWLVLDGFVDASWSETMLSALPEGGHLLLPSQERILRTPKLKIILETDSLQHASPAMVGMGSMVNISASDVGWSSCVQVRAANSSQHESLVSEFIPLCPDIVDTCRVGWIQEIMQRRTQC